MALYGGSYMLIRVIFSAIFYDSQHFGAELFTERCSAAMHINRGKKHPVAPAGHAAANGVMRSAAFDQHSPGSRSKLARQPDKNGQASYSHPPIMR